MRGSFGPWQQQNPRVTPIDGNYDFTHADLSSIQRHRRHAELYWAISPDSSATLRSRAPPTRPTFPSTPPTTRSRCTRSSTRSVDGTTGDTTLDAVQARLLHSDHHRARSASCASTCQMEARAHDVQLDVVDSQRAHRRLPRTRRQDRAAADARRSQPYQRICTYRPAPCAYRKRSSSSATFRLCRTSSSRAPGYRTRVDGLSLRAQGHPEEAGHAFDDDRRIVCIQHERRLQRRARAHFNRAT